jgi:glyoxylase-like metal-dependent hydrolase (beta-lactamase superfamily II)
MAHVHRIALGRVNCYLLPADSGFVLVDTGAPERRARLAAELVKAGCRPGDLKLIVLTHGDYDHAGNALYLRDKYQAKVAMHHEDLARVRRADWTWGTRPRPDKAGWLCRVVWSFEKARPFDVFEADTCLKDGQSLLRYGCDATVLHLPGHTRGSIGLLTSDDDLVCGDLLDGVLRPGLHLFIDDMTAAKESLARVKRLRVRRVYPGHGKPFSLSEVRDH